LAGTKNEIEWYKTAVQKRFKIQDLVPRLPPPATRPNSAGFLPLFASLVLVKSQ
jgi:hypothetical protein